MQYDLRVGVVNLTQSQSVAIVKASVGDVLQAVASYKVTAGANYDYSTATSVTFVVS